MLKVAYALLTNQKKATDNDNQNMEMNEEENFQEVGSEDESEWSTEDKFIESETKDEKNWKWRKMKMLE